MTQSPFDHRTQSTGFGSGKNAGSDPASQSGPLGLGSEIFAHLIRERNAWFAWQPVLIGLGAAGYFQLAREPSAWLAGALLAMAAILSRVALHRAVLGVATAALFFGVLGFSLAKLRTEWVRAPALERSLGLVDIDAFVERVELKPKRGARLTLRPIHIERLKREKLPKRIRVRVLQTVEGLKPGTVIHMRARLAPPPPPALPGGFDFARHAWFQQIGAVGYALTAPKITTHDKEIPWSLRMAAHIEQVRQTIADRMRAVLPNQTGAIAIALVTGERGGISEETNQVYRDAGLFHILSISGMHMAVMAGAVFFLFRLGFAAIPSLTLRYPVKKWSAVIAAVAALGYLALSGGAFATVRSYIMISVMFFAVLLDRPALALRNVALAAVIILLIYPESILDPGFQMSFAAVVALVCVYERLRKSRWTEAFTNFGPVRKTILFFAGIVVSTLVAGLAVAPFAAYHFHNTQHLAVLANLIAMPVSNVLIMPAALGVLMLMPLGLEWPAVFVMGFGIDVMTATAQWVAALPGAVGRIATLPDAAFLLMVLGGLWFLLWQTRWRFLGLSAIALGLAVAPLGPRPDVLIGNKGKDVAVRTATGVLAPIKQKKRVSFGMKRWLEADGQMIVVGKASKQRADAKDPGWCDAVGCAARVKGLTLAVAHHAGALRDDCRIADIVVFNAPKPQGCSKPRAVIDFFDVYYGGTHALYLTKTDPPRIESVAAARGRRPWTRALPGRQKQQETRAARRKVTKTEKPKTSSRDADKTGRDAPPTTFDDDDERTREQKLDAMREDF